MKRFLVSLFALAFLVSQACASNIVINPYVFGGGGGGCSISIVGTPTTGSAIDGTNITLSMPSGVAQNDVVYVGFTRSNTDTVGVGTSSSGWTQLTSLTTGLGLMTFRKVMGASPDASIVLTNSGGASQSSSAIAFAFRCVDTTTPEDGVTPTTATGTSTNPDPASATPTTSGAISIAFAGTKLIDTTGTAAPTGYGDFTQVSSDDTNDTTSYMSWKSGLTGGVAENPAAYTGVTSAAWATTTIIVKPQ